MKLNIWIILLLVIIFQLIFQIHGDINYHKGLREKTENIKSKLKKEIEQRKFLKEQLNNLKQDSFIESMARSKLNLVKKGETAYKICQ